jgi:hypothetical protein
MELAALLHEPERLLERCEQHELEVSLFSFSSFT